MSVFCAIYARYSTDRQNPRSIEDQVRCCRDYAAPQGWQVLEDQVYSDAAMSGGSAEDRPGLCALVEAVSGPDRKFDVLLLDDTSRLSRHQPTAMQLFELCFAKTV
jgi:DNA invertase Pin-like site-specific DNA recombinase